MFDWRPYVRAQLPRLDIPPEREIELAVTAIACYLPARKATRIDPVAALRAD